MKLPTDILGCFIELHKKVAPSWSNFRGCYGSAKMVHTILEALLTTFGVLNVDRFAQNL